MPAERLHFHAIRRTSAFRLTLSLGAVMLAGTLALLAIIYALTARELTQRSDAILRDEAVRLLSAPPADLPARIRAELQRNLHGLNHFALVAADGELAVGNLRPDPTARPDTPVDRNGTTGTIRLLAEKTRQGETLLIGRDVRQIGDLRRRILAIVAASGLAIVLGMMAAAVALSRRPLRRVRDLQAAAAEIVAGRLDTRMPIAGVHDELDQFAATVNVMVEEVGRVVDQVKGVTDAIAHDLRTPLTRVRAQLSRIAREPDTRPEIGSAIDDLDVVLQRFAALLRISELEASGRRQGFSTVDLHALAASVHALYEPLAEDRGVALTLAGRIGRTVEADEKLLFEAVSNLVDNAIKFTPPGGAVAIALGNDGGASIEVRDDGPGIPADERAAVLRRFHRGSSAALAPGSGLGLSVVAAIVHLHGFDLVLDDAGPGLRATIRMAV